MKKKIIRITTNSISLNLLLKGQLGFLNNYYDIIAVAGQDRHLDIVKERERIKVVPIEIERKINLIKDFRSLIKLIYFLYKEKPDIVHSITPKAGLLSMIAAKLIGVPIRMHTFTGLIFPIKNGILKQVLIFTDRILCLSSTNIYAEGKGVKNDIIKFKITKKPVKIIANGNINGIDCNYFTPAAITKIDKINLRSKLGIAEGAFVYLYVGRLVSDKGINELVLAFQEIKIKNSVLILLGDYEQHLDPLNKESVKIIRNNEKIICPGFVDDVRIYYSISDVFVFPSYREGFPNVVLQAASMGLPCIVTNINGSNEIIINGFNGLIIPSRDIYSLKASMVSIYENNTFRNYLSSNCRELICLKYNQRLVWNSIKDEYDFLFDCYLNNKL
jgi:glycosyltransferase involved in cell wall biosynthesis